MTPMNVPTPELAEAKAASRRDIRARRRDRSPADRALVAQGLLDRALAEPTVSGAGCVFAYHPLPTEPDVTLLTEALRRRGCRVGLPRLAAGAGGGGGGLTFAEFTGDLADGEPTTSGMRIPEPTGATLELAQCDVLLMPALAVDHAGVRLGQGGGYYDRTLAPAAAGLEPMPVLVAVIHDDEFLAHLPRETHDTVVDAVLTPTGFHWLREFLSRRSPG